MENADRPKPPPSRQPKASSPTQGEGRGKGQPRDTADSTATNIVAIPLRSLAASFALFLGVFIALVLFWPVVEDTYAALFRNAGNAIVGLSSHGKVWFAQPDAADPQHDVQLVVIDPKNRLQRKTDLSSYRHAYMPTAFIAALMLATPISWARRFRALLWGLLAVQVYVAVKLMLFPIAYGREAADGAWTAAAAVRSLLWVLGATTVGWTLIPLLIWLLVVLCKPARTR